MKINDDGCICYSLLLFLSSLEMPLVTYLTNTSTIFVAKVTMYDTYLNISIAFWGTLLREAFFKSWHAIQNLEETIRDKIHWWKLNMLMHGYHLMTSKCNLYEQLCSHQCSNKKSVSFTSRPQKKARKRLQRNIRRSISGPKRW